MEQALVPLSSTPSWKKERIALVKSFPTTSQLERKKLTLNPSGPGLLFFFMDLRVEKISSAVTSLSRAEWGGMP